MSVAPDILRVIRNTAKGVRFVSWKRIRLTSEQTCAMCWCVMMAGESAYFCREQMVCECVGCRLEADSVEADRLREAQRVAKHPDGDA